MALIGLFGGTFDPIHVGHLRTAFELMHDLSLSEVRFIPCGVPPHGKEPVASAELRLQMVQAAIAGQSEFVVDDRELARSGPSYSVETLESLRSEMPQNSLGLIVGMDAFVSIETWHRSEDLLALAHLIVAHRPGAILPNEGVAGKLLQQYGTNDPGVLAAQSAGHIFVHAVTQLEVSSSAIRETIGKGESPRYLVPDVVVDLLEDSNCYRV